MKFSSLILPALNGIVWGGLAWMGWGGIKHVQSQHVPGYPNFGQIQFYVIFPLAMVSIALIPATLLSQTKWAVIGNIWSVVTLLAVFPYLFFYTGGM